MQLDFGEWRPDQPASAFAQIIRNVIPHDRAYGPLRGLGSTTAALAARAQGAVAARGVTGGTAIFAGDISSLNKLVGTAWSDVTRVSGGSYATPSDAAWEFVQFKDQLVALNSFDEPQVITLSSGAVFADLADAPIAATGATVREFLMLGRLAGDASAVRWSGFDDIEEWASGTNQSGQRVLPDGGVVQRIIGGAAATVFCEQAIFRFDYTGDAYVFQVDKIAEARGALVPGGVANIGDKIFFLDNDGFFELRGGAPLPIGAEKVDRFFFDDLDDQYSYRIRAGIDPRNKLVIWAYPSATGGTGNLDRLMIYNWVSQRWAHAHVDLELLFSTLTQGLTLEDLDDVSASLDALPFSLDSRAYMGGVRQMGAFTTDHELGAFDGEAAEALIETTEFDSGVVVYTDHATPGVDTSDAEVAVGVRARKGDAVTWGSFKAQTDQGWCPIHREGRLVRFRTRIAAASSWTKAEGVLSESRPAGRM